MNLGTWLASAMKMSDRVWERHANPWSVWTRVAILPLLAAAIWSRMWLGWGCLALVLPLIAWTWFNPRAFPRPRHTESWAARAVMGERVWLARNRVAIPRHHAVWAALLSGLAALGLAPMIWGLAMFEIWPALAGLGLILLGKLWFLDRMVWLFADMAAHHKEYAAWVRKA